MRSWLCSTLWTWTHYTSVEACDIFYIALYQVSSVAFTFKKYIDILIILHQTLLAGLYYACWALRVYRWVRSRSCVQGKKKLLRITTACGPCVTEEGWDEQRWERPALLGCRWNGGRAGGLPAKPPMKLVWGGGYFRAGMQSVITWSSMEDVGGLGDYEGSAWVEEPIRKEGGSERGRALCATLKRVNVFLQRKGFHWAIY